MCTYLRCFVFFTLRNVIVTKQGHFISLDSFTVLSVVYCGVPETIENGYIVSTTGADYKANATYECNGGFTHSGHTAMCNETGEWNNLPKCTCM